MKTRRILFFPLFVALGGVAAGCAANPCQDVVDAANKAEQAPGCSSYIKEQLSSTQPTDVDNCTANDEQTTQYEAEATCLNAVTSCDAAGKTRLGNCLERAFSR